MGEKEKQELSKLLWDIANELRGSMDADDFRDYMIGFLFLKYLSDNYETQAQNLLKEDYTPLKSWYENHTEDIEDFEKEMITKTKYILKPDYLWGYLSNLAKTQSENLLDTLEEGFKHIEQASLNSDDQSEISFSGLFSEIHLSSEKLGKTYKEKNEKISNIINTINNKLANHTTDSDQLGDAYEYLIGQFATYSGKKAGEFYTPQAISTILARIVTLDCQNPENGKKKTLKNILDFACGSGSLLLNVNKEMGFKGIGNIYGQDSNHTTYNLARMNMLLHGVSSYQFKIFHGDTLKNEWDIFNELNPAKKIEFDAVVANPPFSLRWEPKEDYSKNFRFADYGVAPKSAADFAFLLHGFHFLNASGTMAIILPHGVLFRGGVEERIRTKLLQGGNIDTIIGLPSNLFYNTGIPVCIMVLKKCKKSDDILFINASEGFEKGKKQNSLLPKHIDKIVETYKFRKEEERFSKRVSLEEIKKNDYNLNISRYINMSTQEEEIDLDEVNKKLEEIEKNIQVEKNTLNSFLEELGLPKLP